MSSNISTSQNHDLDFTQQVINSIGPKTPPRTRQLIASLIQHFHEYAYENELTVAEFMAAIELLNQAGKMSDDKRNETLLMSDLLGAETLLDTIAFEKLASSTSIVSPTDSAILGPFYRPNAPVLPFNGSIIQTSSTFPPPPKELIARLHGRVLNASTRQPIVNAKLDVWQAATNGLYEQQDVDQPDFNLRGQFETDEEGRYAFHCLLPTPYPIPNDGPGGKLLKILDRHPYRPAHIHFIVTHPEYHSLTTQLYSSQDPYLTNDTVFAVKHSLVVEFTPRINDSENSGNGNEAGLNAVFDVSLSPKSISTSISG